jgi:hypothetical protein
MAMIFTVDLPDGILGQLSNFAAVAFATQSRFRRQHNAIVVF